MDARYLMTTSVVIRHDSEIITYRTGEKGIFGELARDPNRMAREFSVFSIPASAILHSIHVKVTEAFDQYPKGSLARFKLYTRESGLSTLIETDLAGVGVVTNSPTVTALFTHPRDGRISFQTPQFTGTPTTGALEIHAVFSVPQTTHEVV